LLLKIALLKYWILTVAFYIGDFDLPSALAGGSDHQISDRLLPK